MVMSKKIILFLVVILLLEIKCVHYYCVSKVHSLKHYYYVDGNRVFQRVYFFKERKRKEGLTRRDNSKLKVNNVQTNEYIEQDDTKNIQIGSNGESSMNKGVEMEKNMDMDLFNNDSLKLTQWYCAQEVKERWAEKHIENIRKNYQKVLLNNKYNELFNMYRNVNNNNVENYKKRVKTNRINPSIYVKKRLVSATAKYIKMSFIKTRKILWKIRYMPIIKAFAFLYYYGTNKYTVNIYKCIKSCLYNAINKYGKDNIRPVFHTLQANMGGYTKKVNIRAKGKTDIIREPHTHIRVVLEV